MSVVAVLGTSGPLPSSKGGDPSLSNLQHIDRTLASYFFYLSYLENGTLPDEDADACELLLSKDRYTVIDGTLYYVEKDKTLKVIPPPFDL